jgi:hypothetical protein
MVGEHQLKHPWVGTGPPTDSPGWLYPMQVTSEHEERDEQSACVSGKMGLTNFFGIWQVLATLAVTMAALVAAAGASPSCLGGAGPLHKKAHTKNCLALSIRYVHEGYCMPFLRLVDPSIVRELKVW